jgi:type IV fimbrial biogenesis protein FimT
MHDGMGDKDGRMLMRHAHAAAGFTMIEALVTLGIFAILTALGIPAMRSWLADNQVRAVTDSLQNGLRLAQAESLRSSRQVVFALTNNAVNSSTALPVSAIANGSTWAIYTLPSMTDGSEAPNFIQSGILSSTNSGVAINSNGTAALCFNEVGRLISSANPALATVTGGATCTVPTTGTPPAQVFNITLTGADRPLEVKVALGGQVHMCDPNVVLSANYPEGC